MRAQKRQPDVVPTIPAIMVSRAMRQVDAVLRSVAKKEVTLTFVGESGTGKEVLARRVHDLSDRRRGPFVPINCAAIPESLFETELFGHERGAFTGATDLVRGKVEAAEKGTLFLDEIGELPLAMQAKLLRFLENLRFMRVGGSRKITADVRLLCATLRPLESDVRAGRFREDLFYRIHGLPIRVPPLRERRADIGPLVDQFVAQLSARHGVPPPRLSRQVKEALLRHDWPGNARQLRNVVEMLCLLRGGRAARVTDLPESLALTSSSPSGHVTTGTMLAIDVDEGLEAATRRIVERALALDGGSKARAAERIGVSVRTLQRYAAAGRIDAPARSPTGSAKRRS
jgi:transcriptional regulator with PAS, ATPase and Fis domain